MSAREAAEYLGVSTQAVYAIAHRLGRRPGYPSTFDPALVREFRRVRKPAYRPRCA